MLDKPPIVTLSHADTLESVRAMHRDIEVNWPPIDPLPLRNDADVDARDWKEPKRTQQAVER